MTDVGRARRVATDAHMVHSCNTIVAAAAVDANVADRCLVFVRLWRLASDGDRRRPVSVVRILSINNMIPFELAGRHLVKAVRLCEAGGWLYIRYEDGFPDNNRNHGVGFLNTVGLLELAVAVPRIDS